MPRSFILSDQNLNAIDVTNMIFETRLEEIRNMVRKTSGIYRL